MQPEKSQQSQDDSPEIHWLWGYPWRDDLARNVFTQTDKSQVSPVTPMIKRSSKSCDSPDLRSGQVITATPSRPNM